MVTEHPVKNILLLEDMELALEFLTIILCKYYGEKVSVHGALSYEQAVQIAEDNHIDAFVLDLELGAGKKGGIDFAKWLRAGKYAKAGIIFTTADAARMSDGINRFRCFGYITKPYETRELLDALDSLLYDSGSKLGEVLTIQEEQMVIDVDDKNFHLEESKYRVHLTEKRTTTIKLSDIIFLESFVKNTVIHTIQGSGKELKTKHLSLSKFMEDMKGYNKADYFYQCKNCYVINTHYCQYYDPKLKALILKHGGREIIVDVKRELQSQARMRFGEKG
ncbi:MAG: response regulator [Oscillospiraceae bacterium]|nr:response regulator [Oscillospiraceae bacterium]